MLWLVFSLLTALTVATQDAWMKRWFSGLRPLEMAAYPMFYSTPVFLLSLLFIEIPPLGERFWPAFLVSLPLNAIAFVLYMTAIRMAPLSLTVPYLAFTPVFMIFTGALFLGETLNGYGILGILFICAGSYVLNLDDRSRGVLAPLLAAGRQTGARIMLFVAFLFSFCAVIGKVGIVDSSVLFFQAAFFVAHNVLLTAALIVTGKTPVRMFFRYPVKGAVGGLLLFLHALFHGLAIAISTAAYMISVKRLSILFSVIYGGVVFREEHIRTRLAGAGLMVAGAVVITLWG